MISFIPKPIIKIFANQYVAGTTLKEVLQISKYLNQNKLLVTIDILGEHTKSTNECDRITNNYIKILKNINKNKINANISIKPSHIGTDINNDLFLANLNKIINQASKYKNFVRIDMEDSNLTDISINAYKKSYKKELGIVLQAYLYRTENDIKNLSKNNNIRLCKGIYNEDKNIAIKDPNKINQNYLKLLEIAFKKGIYVAIATHDKSLIHKSLELINTMNLDNSKFEFQMLYGVPMNDTIKFLLKNEYKVRIYLPFGPSWYDYSIRRIKENPNISLYVIKNIFIKIKEAL